MVKILEITDLSYKDFNKINISFENKTFYSIIGSNNSGKTTLFKLIAGFLPSNDVICCDDCYLNKENSKDYIINLGIVERINKNSFIYKMVFDEMLYPLHNLGYSKKASIEIIKEMLTNFEVEHFIDKSINELTYYEKQLLLIIISLLHKPSVLLLDSVLEIFPNRQKEKIISNINKIINDGLTVINFSNCLDEAYYSDKIILLDHFKIMGEYDKSDIYKNDKLFYEHNLEIPFITDLSIKLKMYDLLNKNYDDLKRMVDDLWP